MPSSTSNSSSNHPPWLKVLAISMCVAALLVAGWEGVLRRQELVPSLDPDGQALWSSQRDRVSPDNQEVVVFVGSSEMEAAISREAFSKALPNARVVQLALNARTPFAVLRDLINDPDFRGVVVVNIVPGEMTRDGSEPWVRYYRDQWNWSEKFDFRLSSFVDLALATRATDNSPTWFAFREITGSAHFAGVRFRDFRLDRMNLADPSLPYWVRSVEHVKRRAAKPIQGYYEEPKKWMKQIHAPFEELRQLEPEIREFHARGGRVVVVRIPASNDHHPDYYAEIKKLAWDKWASTTIATPIHFLEVEAMSELKTRDHNHLDASNAPAFTTALIEELIAKGAIHHGEAN